VSRESPHSWDAEIPPNASEMRVVSHAALRPMRAPYLIQHFSFSISLFISSYYILRNLVNSCDAWDARVIFGDWGL
jgi:hypothetical protein